ncbi:hypothetical protein DL93DRAFT_786623 [Clavulina sp. PMI_390]|nr:hypothetical protein DL93DRAFT_786623 [Clavulina sp. PMI_390]
MRDAHSSVPSTLPSFDDVPSRPPFGPDSTSPIHFSHLTSPYPIIRRSSQPILPSQIVRTLLQPGDDPPNVSFPNHPSDPHSDDRIVHIATTTTTIPNSIFHQSHKGFNPTPASLLPVELLREVFRHTPPDAHRDIFAFSAVNSFWRGVCLSLPELFSTANWDDWSVPAIVEWCRRGNNDGLVVKLGQRAVRRAVMSMESLPYQPLPAIARGRGIARNHSYNGQALANDHPSFQENVSKYIRLLDETSLSWISFSMEFDRGDPTMSLVHELLPRWSCPQLRALTLIDLDNESQNPPFLVLPNMAPYLEELICKDVHIIRASPWANLQRVILDVDFWTQGIERSSIFQTISHAEMLVFDGCGFSGVGGGNIVLHNVRQVTLVDDSVTGFAEWTLRHISFPRATRLTLRGTRPYPNEFPDAEKQVIKHFPRSWSSHSNYGSRGSPSCSHSYRAKRRATWRSSSRNSFPSMSPPTTGTIVARSRVQRTYTRECPPKSSEPC